jgi:hypothetical protein
MVCNRTSSEVHGPSCAQGGEGSHQPIFTLGGVAVGAILSYVATVISERTRRRWDLDRLWNEKRLDSYARYAEAVKHKCMLAQRIAVSAGLDVRAQPLDCEEGLRLLAEAEAEAVRGVSYEKVVLLGSRDTVAALYELNKASWKLDWFARGKLDDDDRAGWDEAMNAYAKAFDRFHRSARADLSVPGEYFSRDQGLSPLPTSDSANDIN